MDKADCLPHYASIDFESAKNFYDNSSTILETLRTFDQNIDTYINDFIKVNNAKVSPAPVDELIDSLDTIFKKIELLPNNYALYWYKQIINQIDIIKTSIAKLNPDNFSQISESIGSLAGSYTMYNIYTTPYYAYNKDDIRPACYIPNNVVNKLNRYTYANICQAGMKVDALFMHNLAPMDGEKDTNLIQSSNTYFTESAALYNGPMMSSTTHGDNLVTDTQSVNIIYAASIAIKTQIKTTYKTLYNVINALKNRTVLHTTNTRDTQNISFSSLTHTNFGTETHISEIFDLLQQKISDYDKQITIESQLS